MTWFKRKLQVPAWLVVLLLLAILSLATVSVLQQFTTLLRTPSSISASPQPELSTLRNHKIWYVAGGGELLATMLSRLETLGLEAQQLDSVDTTPETLSMVGSADSLVLFDGNWIGGHMDYQTGAFLNATASQQTSLVMVGGYTSIFFEALQDAEVLKFAEGRNPGYYDPPMVGFRLKSATTPQGSIYYYPSILNSNTTHIDTLLEALDRWLTNTPSLS